MTAPTNLRLTHGLIFTKPLLWCAAAMAIACAPPKTQSPVSETPVTQRDVHPVKEKTPPLPRAMEKNLATHFAPAFSFGVAMEPRYLDELGVIIETTFNRLTAENVMKCARIHPQPDEYNYGPADRLADFARKHDMAITGHALVWYRETPPWLVDGDKEAVSAKLKSHIETVVARYADVTDNWDVVNEAISDSSGKTYRDGDEGSKLFSVLGEELMPLAFSYAEQAVKTSGKDIDLYYNDYNMVQPEKRKKAIQAATALREQGIRIDGIGAQAHWNMQWPSTAEIQSMIDDIVAAGFKVKISELDVSLYTKDDWGAEKWEPEMPFTEELAQAQAARYKEIMEVLTKNSEHVTSVTLWGLSDDHTWLDFWPAKNRDNHPLLFDDANQPKPAYFALFDVPVEGPQTEQSEPRDPAPKPEVEEKSGGSGSDSKATADTEKTAHKQ